MQMPVAICIQISDAASSGSFGLWPLAKGQGVPQLIQLVIAGAATPPGLHMQETCSLQT